MQSPLFSTHFFLQTSLFGVFFVKLSSRVSGQEHSETTCVHSSSSSSRARSILPYRIMLPVAVAKPWYLNIVPRALSATQGGHRHRDLLPIVAKPRYLTIDARALSITQGGHRPAVVSFTSFEYTPAYITCAIENCHTRSLQMRSSYLVIL